MNQIAAIKNGDETVFEQVYVLQHEKLYFYILKKTSSSYLAEEVVQLTFIKFWTYRDALNAELPLESQLFRIAKTTLIDLLRKNATQRQLAQQYADIIPVDNENVVSSLLYKETGDRIKAVIDSMPPVRKKIFKLSREGGMTHKEIADRLTLTTKNVENHVAKAIKQLRKAFRLLILVSVIWLLFVIANYFFL